MKNNICITSINKREVWIVWVCSESHFTLYDKLGIFVEELQGIYLSGHVNYVIKIPFVLHINTDELAFYKKWDTFPFNVSSSSNIHSRTSHSRTWLSQKPLRKCELLRRCGPQIAKREQHDSHFHTVLKRISLNPRREEEPQDFCFLPVAVQSCSPISL